MATITGGSVTITPVQTLGYVPRRVVRTVTHLLVDGGARYTRMASADLRSGEMPLLFTTAATAQQALSVLSEDVTFLYTDSSFTGLGMSFVVTDDLRLELQPSRNTFVLTVPYGEVVL